VSVYFQENRPSGLATLQVHISGGEPSEVTISKMDLGSLRDISPDGSSLLLSAVDPQARRWDTWIQPLPAGPPRLILKDARWPLWTPDGKSILFARNQDHDLFRANADCTDARRLATLPDITWPEISPDGRQLRFAVAPKADLWEAKADGSGAHVILPEYQIAGSALGKWIRTESTSFCIGGPRSG
jgi:WD40-like Beta Propeller Repeat